MAITLAVEGRVDEAVAKRLLRDAGLESGPAYGFKGKQGLDAKLAGYNSAAKFTPWLVLRDLNGDADCAPTLRHTLLPAFSTHMRLHIVVHAVESWLLADHDAFSSFFAVSAAKIPRRPEDLLKPKSALVDLARQSRRTAVRDAIVPRPGAAVRVGPGYVALVTEFASSVWRPGKAARRSESLARLRNHLANVSD